MTRSDDSLDLSLIPLPAEVEAQPGHLDLRGGLTLSTLGLADEAAGSAGDIHALIDLLAGWLADAGVDLRRDTALNGDGAAGLTLSLTAEDTGPEAYRLSVSPSQIELAAADRAGLFYAAQTLRQLIDSAQRGRLRCVTIRDAPRFAWRGFMLDSARHCQPVSWIKQHLDRLASLKMNRLHWHLSDDHAWRAEIKRYPRLTEAASWPGAGQTKGFYTQQEMREVVQYAADRHIQVIPEIDTPAHCNAALVAYPELSCGGQPLPIDEDAGWEAFTARAGRRAYCAGKPQTYEFLQGVWTELAEIFDPQYLHVGGDETPEKAWQDCPHCGELRQRLGADNAGLRLHFMNRLADFCHQQLRLSTIGWTEGVSDQIPEGQIVQAWFPHEAAQAARLGYDVINSNHEWTYADYPANEEDRKHRPDWMLVLPLEKVYHFEPTPDGLEEAHRQRILGSEMSLWTESLPDAASLEKQIMPRLLAFAEVVWTPRLRRGYDSFRSRLNQYQSAPDLPRAVAV